MSIYISIYILGFQLVELFFQTFCSDLLCNARVMFFSTSSISVVGDMNITNTYHSHRINEQVYTAPGAPVMKGATKVESRYH